jgi:hypothetical protein
MLFLRMQRSDSILEDNTLPLESRDLIYRSHCLISKGLLKLFNVHCSSASEVLPDGCSEVRTIHVDCRRLFHCVDKPEAFTFDLLRNLG